MIETNLFHELYGNRLHDEQDWLRAEQDQQKWLRAEQDEQDCLRAEQEIFTPQR
jgi:hypothetical protein